MSVPYPLQRDRLDNEHLRLLLSFVLREDANCVDVGAHKGIWLTEFLRLAPNGRHVAYEPIPEFAERLRQQFPTVDVREAALSNTEGEGNFVYVPELPGYSGLRERNYPHPTERKTLTVRTERLDDHWPQDRRLDLMIIDVEGGEAWVLEGATSTLRHHRPVVVFEHGRGAADHYGVSPRDVYEILHDGCGQRIFDLDGNGPYTLTAFEEEFAAGRRWNYVARA
jgi:FkbM family methyltransferase